MDRARSMKFLMLAITGLLALPDPGDARAQDQTVCGPEVKQQVAAALSNDLVQKNPYSPESLAVQKEVYEKYSYCASDVEALPADAFKFYAGQFCGKLTYLGSTYYEQMRCCGYDPQKRLFGCPVEIKQPFGFGPAPFPGSAEYVLSCVDLGGGYQPVALDKVHLADAVSGSPVWNFAVIARATEKLAQQPLKGQTLRARSILSWNLVPTDCSYAPIWGNVIDYKIRLDP